MFCDVLILQPESNHDQIYTYLLPEKVEAQVGSLVSVPVRQHLLQGLILKIYEEKPQLKMIKPLKEVLSDRPLLSSTGLKLASWLSDYYVCSLNKAVQVFLPPPVRQKEKEVLLPGPAKPEAHLFLSEMEKAIFQEVMDNEARGITRRQIVEKYGIEAKAALESLKKAGCLQVNKVFAPRVLAKKIRAVRLTGQCKDGETIRRKAPRQAEIIEMLKAGPKLISELQKDGKSVSPVLKALKEKGWVETFEVDAGRDPKSVVLETKRPPMLNGDQQAACQAICESIRKQDSQTFYLFGVTGSGKTEVYLKAVEEALSLGKQTLYLVPEIALTPQITSILLDAFGPEVAVLHSALSAGERYDEWMRIRGGEARVILGPRSAVFAPFSDLGLIIIDEEHENTYKQNEPDPRYDARQVALELAKYYQATLVFGSATPSLQGFYKATEGQYRLLELPQRAGQHLLPDITIIDMKKEIKEGNTGLFSSALIGSLKRVLASGEQAILFINRRGYHTFVLCRECGHPLMCPHCSISLTYHASGQVLTCHYCGFKRTVPRSCPACGSGFIRFFGTGTERVERECSRLFPQARYVRMDTDTTQNKGSHAAILKEFAEGKAQILIGTQMVAKGFDFPAVTLVGVINADTLLNMPDFQAAERTFQLLIQVAGRAGRGEKKGEVLVQTHYPEHYLFPTVVQNDYRLFFQQEMQNRLILQYPPYHYLTRVLVSGFVEKKVVERVEFFAKMLKIEINSSRYKTELLGPTPAPIAIIRGRYRYHLLLKSENLTFLQKLARLIKDKAGELPLEPRIIIDIEPQSIL
ncbi:MAG: primosomal protein [Peptococcaceae bacterium]|jgi:primosomal protein N' (replication factor Y)|nr:primosomal protein [Peptococcaceae bacterium]